MIDHTRLKPGTGSDDIEKLCQEAKIYGFASVCVNPYHVSKAWERLKTTHVKGCTVIGFPLGANTMHLKQRLPSIKVPVKSTWSSILAVKTSTGFGTDGATIEDVALMKEMVEDNMLIKASGGVKNDTDLLAMVQVELEHQVVLG